MVGIHSKGQASVSARGVQPPPTLALWGSDCAHRVRPCLGRTGLQAIASRGPCDDLGCGCRRAACHVLLWTAGTSATCAMCWFGLRVQTRCVPCADSGCRYKCNVCHVLNEVPMEYFCHLDHNGKRVDLAMRPELSTGTVEYVAPAEYMVCLRVRVHARLSSCTCASMHACGQLRVCLCLRKCGRCACSRLAPWPGAPEGKMAARSDSGKLRAL